MDRATDVGESRAVEAPIGQLPSEEGSNLLLRQLYGGKCSWEQEVPVVGIPGVDAPKGPSLHLMVPDLELAGMTQCFEWGPNQVQVRGSMKYLIVYGLWGKQHDPLFRVTSVCGLPTGVPEEPQMGAAAAPPLGTFGLGKRVAMVRAGREPALGLSVMKKASLLDIVRANPHATIFGGCAAVGTSCAASLILTFVTGSAIISPPFAMMGLIASVCYGLMARAHNRATRR